MNHPRPLGMTVPAPPAFLTHSNPLQPQAIFGLRFARCNPHLITISGMDLGKGLPNYWGNFSTNRILKPLSATHVS